MKSDIHFSALRTLLILAFVLSACAGAASPTPGPSPATPTTRATQRLIITLATTATQTPPPTATPLPPLEAPLVWLFRGQAPADLARVNDELNRRLSARGFNARVELHPLDPLGYEHQVEEQFEAKEPFDLVSLNGAQLPWLVEKGFLLPLTAYPNPEMGREENLLETRAPGLRDVIPAVGWQAVAEDGKVYAVPNTQGRLYPRGVVVRQEVVQALNLQAELDAARSYEDLTPIFEKIDQAIRQGIIKKAGFPGSENTRRVLGQTDLLDPLNAGYDVLALPFAVRYDDAEVNVVNWFETEAFLNLATLRRAWLEAGYTPGTALNPDEIMEGMREGRYLAAVGVPLDLADWEARYGQTWVGKTIAPVFLPAAAPRASVTGVNAAIAGDLERVKRVLALLELLQSDAEFYNLLAYGVEGEHWSWVDAEQKTIRLLPGSRYKPDFAEQLGNRQLAYPVLLQGQEPPIVEGIDWKAALQPDAGIPVSPALGFSFDPGFVPGEWAGVQGLIYEWSDVLVTGQAADVEKARQKLVGRLEEAGLGAIEEELLRQVRAWKRSREP